MNENGEWALSVERANNGFIVSRTEELSDGDGYRTDKILFEFSDEEVGRLGELKAFVALVHEMAEFFDVGYAKHASHNLNVTVEMER